MASPRNSTINLGAVSFLLAEPNAQASLIIHSILRGFGARRVIEARTTIEAIEVLLEQKVDMMLVEPRLPEGGGLAFVQAIRQNPDNPYRTLPIVVVTGDARVSTIKAARNCGADMIVAKPVSPAGLYERLVWLAFQPRRFIETPTYFGPDRRSKEEVAPGGFDRRSKSGAASGAKAEAATLSQPEFETAIGERR